MSMGFVFLFSSIFLHLFPQRLKIFIGKAVTSSGRLIPRYLNFFKAILNVSVFIMSFFVFLLLVY